MEAPFCTLTYFVTAYSCFCMRANLFLLAPHNGVTEVRTEIWWLLTVYQSVWLWVDCWVTLFSVYLSMLWTCVDENHLLSLPLNANFHLIIHGSVVYVEASLGRLWYVLFMFNTTWNRLYWRKLLYSMSNGLTRVCAIGKGDDYDAILSQFKCTSKSILRLPDDYYGSELYSCAFSRKEKQGHLLAVAGEEGALLVSNTMRSAESQICICGWFFLFFFFIHHFTFPTKINFLLHPYTFFQYVMMKIESWMIFILYSGVT